MTKRTHGKHVKAAATKLRVQFDKPSLLVLGLAIVLLGGAIALQKPLPHQSVEIAFSDSSKNGMEIIPASCPSTPDFAGQCNGNYNVTASCVSNAGTIYLTWDFSAGGAGNTYILVKDQNNNVILNDTSPFGISGSYSIPGLGAGQYTWGMSPDNGDVPVSGGIIVPDCAVVVVCPNYLASSEDYGGYRLPGSTLDKRANKNTSPICLQNGSGVSYFVPANSVTEINAFKTHLPSGVTVSNLSE